MFDPPGINYFSGHLHSKSNPRHGAAYVYLNKTEVMIMVIDACVIQLLSFMLQAGSCFWTGPYDV